MCIRALIVACLLAISGLLIATPAQAAPATVYIYKVYFDSPGSDTLSAERGGIVSHEPASYRIPRWLLQIGL
jgi:hypothetical protein